MNKSSGSNDPKKGPAVGLIIALSVAAGVVVGSAGTYVLTRPEPAAAPAASVVSGQPAASALPSMSGQPSVTIQPSAPPQPQSQFTPAPQPPGEPPPGKVWSVEHGHWHDAPVTSVAVPPAIPPAPAPAPAPAVAPAQK